MKGLFWVIGLASLAVLAALVLQDFHGNVVVLVPPYRLDMALAAFALALLLFFIALLGLVKFLSSLISLPTLAAQYRVRRADDQAKGALAQAVVELASGRFSRAFSAANSAKQNPELAPAAQLLAAQAAHRLNNHTERDALLNAARNDARLKDAALLTTAQTALDDRDPRKAREALSQLGSGPARRVQSLRLKLEAARGSGDFDEVIRIVQLLHKHNDLSLTAAKALTEHAATHKLSAARYDVDKLRLAWRELEQGIIKHPALLSLHNPHLMGNLTQHFAALGEVPYARTLVCQTIANAPIEEREGLFGVLAELALHPDSKTHLWNSATLSQLEGWRLSNPRSAAAALAAGAACNELELWGKARVFLQDCVKIDTHQAYSSPSTPKPSSNKQTLGKYAKRASLVLAELENHLGERDKALNWYQLATRSNQVAS